MPGFFTVNFQVAELELLVMDDSALRQQVLLGGRRAAGAGGQAGGAVAGGGGVSKPMSRKQLRKQKVEAKRQSRRAGSDDEAGDGGNFTVSCPLLVVGARRPCGSGGQDRRLLPAACCSCRCHPAPGGRWACHASPATLRCKGCSRSLPIPAAPPATPRPLPPAVRPDASPPPPLTTSPQANLADPRFSALVDNPEFALDPTHPAFGKTQGAAAVAAAVAGRKRAKGEGGEQREQQRQKQRRVGAAGGAAAGGAEQQQPGELRAMVAKLKRKQGQQQKLL